VFGVLMVVIILIGAMWGRAPRTPWFWLVGAISGLLFFLPDKLQSPARPRARILAM